MDYIDNMALVATHQLLFFVKKNLFIDIKKVMYRVIIYRLSK